MKSQKFTIKQKGIDKTIGEISFNEKGVMSYDLSEKNVFINEEYPERALQRIITTFHDSFGRVLPFEVTDGKITVDKKRDSLIPGRDGIDKIITSFRNYIKVLDPIYDIQEVTE